ncbi:MAG TPA: cupin domain-containing protein [Thermoleophilia bacterium]|nr:cupin domain-containing protein [Thermoleophilia bacterium]
MPVGRIEELAAAPMAGEGVEGVVKRVPLSPREGWDGYVMRVFDVDPGGHTPRHTHPWPHVNYIISGRGTLHIDGVEHSVEAGSYALVPAGATHQFANPGAQLLRFICIVPEEGEG